MSGTVFQNDCCPRARLFLSCESPDEVKMSVLMDWNVNWGIYHDVESKLLHGRGNWLPWPARCCQKSQGDCQRSSCWVSVTTSWMSAVACRVFLLWTGCKWKMKNNLIWLMKRNELLSCYCGRKTPNNESDRNLANKHSRSVPSR